MRVSHTDGILGKLVDEVLAAALFPVGTKVLLDKKDKAIVKQVFPKGSTSYLFPHYKVDIVDGDKNVAIAINRVTKSANNKKAGNFDGMIMAFSTDPDIEFLYDIFGGVVQIGLGGEWWVGKVKYGKNVLHHKKEKVDEAYLPVTVNIENQGHNINFNIMGGFLDKGGTIQISGKAK